MQQLGPLLLAWAFWCFGHSFLLTLRLRRFCEKSPFFKRWGRLLFNIFSTVTVLALVCWTYQLDGPLVFKWPFYLWPLRLALFFGALYLMLAAFKVYGFMNFFGLKPEKRELKREGILLRLRHPLYTAGFIFLWVRDQSLSWFWVDLLLTGYLLIGTKLEEKKLKLMFPEYEQYQKEVPGFWPRLKKGSS